MIDPFLQQRNCPAGQVNLPVFWMLPGDIRLLSQKQDFVTCHTVYGMNFMLLQALWGWCSGRCITGLVSQHRDPRQYPAALLWQEMLSLVYLVLGGLHSAAAQLANLYMQAPASHAGLISINSLPCPFVFSLKDHVGGQLFIDSCLTQAVFRTYL